MRPSFDSGERFTSLALSARAAATAFEMRHDGGIRAAAHLAILLLAAMACCAAPASAQNTGSTGGGLAMPTLQPTLAIRYMIRTQGTSNDTLGQIMMYAGSSPSSIAGWQECSGQVLAIADNPALYAAIGGGFGGDGTTTFGLPDLRGRLPVGTGTGAGLAPWAQGQMSGAESYTLTTSNMPSHAHTLSVSVEASGTTLATGGGQAFGIRQPSLGVSYITPLNGSVPSSGGGGSGYYGADPVVGQVSLTARSAVPAGWAACDGSIVSIAGNSSMYGIMGTTYGGNGTTTFALPDLQGRAAIGQGVGGAGYLSPQALGQVGGVESVALTEAQLPAHTHTIAPPPFQTGTTGLNQLVTMMQPTLGLNYIIAMVGAFPLDSGPLTDDGPYLGQIALFSGTFAPDGWAFAQGQILPVTGNQALFSRLGLTYGGNGSTFFNLPDLRGTVAVGAGLGAGLSTWIIGDRGGDESIQLLGSELPAHVHTVPEPTGVAMLLAAAAIWAGCRTKARRATPRREAPRRRS